MKALNVTECVQFTPNLLLRKDSKHSRKPSNSQNTAKKLFEIPTQTQKTKSTSVQGSYLPSAIHKMLQTEFSWEMRLSLIISAQWCKTNIQNICYSLKHFMLCSQELCKNKNRAVASITQVCTVHRDTRQNAKYTSSVNFNSARNWPLSSAWPGCLPHWSASSPAVLPEPAISAYFFCSHPAKGNSPWTRELEPHTVASRWHLWTQLAYLGFCFSSPCSLDQLALCWVLFSLCLLDQKIQLPQVLLSVVEWARAL